jgi:hypothetical protein
MRDPDLPPPKHLFTFRSAGWVLLLSALVTALVIVMTLGPAIQRAMNRPPGDGRNPGTYGFALEPSLVPADGIVAGQLHRDLLEALVEPPTIPGSGVKTWNEENRGKYLVTDDRVVGVVVNGEARAYPLQVLALHEICNDVLGGAPIGVTYSPLCDSVVVFDRRVSDETVEFGVSGLLYNSNLLMYDRQEDIGGESLWSQLRARAVTGPAAAAETGLALIPVTVTHWADWLATHPETTVLAPNDNMIELYKGTNYASYFLRDDLLFPVSPSLPEGMPTPKTPCVIVFHGGESRCYTLPYIAQRTTQTDSGTWFDTLGGERFTFHYFSDPAVALVRHAETGEPATVVYSFLFAWYAMHPGTEIVTLENGSS